MIYALTENYLKKYDFTFQGMYQTLTYMHNICEIEFGEKIVGLIPYYYKDAEKHYQSVKAVGENNKQVDTSGMYHKKMVYIDPKKKKKIKTIDITTVKDGGGVV
jgi:hypothetical protein